MTAAPQPPPLRELIAQVTAPFSGRVGSLDSYNQAVAKDRVRREIDARLSPATLLDVLDALESAQERLSTCRISPSTERKCLAALELLNGQPPA